MEINVSQFALDDYMVAGSTAYLRFYNLSQWTDAGGDEHLPDETPDGRNFYKEIALTVNSATHRIDETSFDITSTEDAIQNQFARYAIKLYDANRKLVAEVGDFYVPSSLGPNITWAQLVLANRAQRPWRDFITYNRTETNALIAQQILAVVFPDASATTKGLAKLSVAPVSATNPIVVGDNDLRVIVATATAAGRSKMSVPPASAINPIAVGDNDPRVIDVTNFGAVGDGATNDGPAILAAINAAIAAGGQKVIYFPPSAQPYQVKTTVAKNFGATYDIVFQGCGSGAAIRIATGAGVDGFNFTGGLSLTFRDLCFVGTDGVQDTRNCLKFTEALKVSFQDCYFYGIASSEDVIGAWTSYLYVERCHFLGCAADGSIGSYSIVNNHNWRAIVVRDCRFYDYGQLNGVNYTKGGIGFPAAWISANQPKTTLREVIPGSSPGLLSGAGSQGVFTVEGCFFDEGAGFSIRGVCDPAISLIERAVFRNNNHNVTQAGGAGVYLYGTNWALIENSWFGYVYTGLTNAIVLNGAGHVTVRNVLAMQKANSIAVLAPTSSSTRLTIVDSVFGYLFLQTPTEVDFTFEGKRYVRTIASSGSAYNYADILPSRNLEVSASLALGDVTWTKGTGSPEGIVTAPVGSFYSCTDGGAGTAVYFKESGAGANGWIAK